MYTKINILIN